MMKTQMHSVEMQIQSSICMLLELAVFITITAYLYSIAMMKVQGCLTKSNEIMHSVNKYSGRDDP